MVRTRAELVRTELARADDLSAGQTAGNGSSVIADDADDEVALFDA